MTSDIPLDAFVRRLRMRAIAAQLDLVLQGHWCPNPDIVAAIAREVLSGALTCQCGRLNPKNCREDPCRSQSK